MPGASSVPEAQAKRCSTIKKDIQNKNAEEWSSSSVMEKKTQSARLQPLSYAGALRGDQGARKEVKPTPPPTPTPSLKAAAPLKPSVTSVPSKPTVQQPPPAVPIFKQPEQAKSTLHTNSITAPSREFYPQLSQSVAKVKLAPISYAQAVTGERISTLVVKKKEKQGPQVDLQKAGGEMTAHQELEKGPQKIPQKSAPIGGQKNPQKSPEKNTQKTHKKSPKKKKKKGNPHPETKAATSDSTIKAQHTPHHQKASKESQEPEKKSVSTIERCSIAPQGGGHSKESTRSKNACGDAAVGGQNQGKKFHVESPRGRSPVKVLPCIRNAPTKPKAAAWGAQNWRSPTTIRPRQRSTTFPSFENSSHSLHNQSPTLAARYQFGQSPSTSFATGFAKHPQYNHHGHILHNLSKSSLPTMGNPYGYGRRCRALDAEQWTKTAATPNRSSNFLGSADFAIHCDEPGEEGLWPEAINQQRRIAEYIKQHDRKEINLWRGPRDWDVRIDCGHRPFLAHRQMLAREQSTLKELATVLPDGSKTHYMCTYTTPDRMANVLAFIYDKGTMEGERFKPSEDNTLDGGIILNNTMAYLAGVETDFPLLRDVALSNLQKAIQGIRRFFDDADGYIQDYANKAREDGTPFQEWDCLISFVTDDELANFYRPFRIAMQTLYDFHVYTQTKFCADEMLPLRFAMWGLMKDVYHVRLVFSKAFRNHEAPQWEESGLIQFWREEDAFFVGV
ncbi:hypothetical protein NEUTE1DRAFT_106082 [Neurospora tetrasperma FGSC 2508]|uniref:BTB domain-containing protein n=1 Tax=Neurospora tetrasperma (strain FGSC 2508 / ATCC MYA-4615 / P0657) TaxID=510951 RepID=F8N1G3_NEUT8|nr:uncharacterized protein NEUTE1DRAFT_106082 [Neurospora tetrasperma FGSC 2508]EGO53143.1 hypothetical protein NEUTE1DRAFT_106082 [Neurospora tetrasperma FGSC 2508]